MPRTSRSQFFPTISLGICRCGRLSQHHSTWSFWTGAPSVFHPCYVSPVRTMEVFREEHALHNFDDEPMVMGRNSRSVSFVEPMLSFPAYNLAPLVLPFMGSKTGSKIFDIFMMNMDPFLVSVSTLPNFHVCSWPIKSAVMKQ
jgi:hypothetical protein